MLSEELLKRFKDGKVVLHCPTKEVFELALSAVREFGCKMDIDKSYWDSYMEFTGIDYEYGNRVSYSNLSYYMSDYPHLEIVKLYLEDFRESSEIASVTIMNNSSNPIKSCKVYTKAKVTKNSSGYTIEILPTSKFTDGDLFVISSGKLGKVIGAPEYVNGKYTYEIQWTDGKKNKCQPEDSMIKLEEAFK